MCGNPGMIDGIDCRIELLVLKKNNKHILTNNNIKTSIALNLVYANVIIKHFPKESYIPTVLTSMMEKQYLSIENNFFNLIIKILCLQT